MGAFFKTFFICLVLAFGFLSYKYFGTDSYNDNLNVSKNSPVFGDHKEIEKNFIDKNSEFDNKKEENIQNNKPENEPQEKKQTIQKYAHTCYFFSNSGQLIPLKRELTLKPTLESQINLLLRGPLISETKKGIYSEIPANVDLISLKKDENSIIVNLSSNFGTGGGSQSIENRVKQLSKTVKSIEPNKNVYLHINGKEVEYLGGDGVYIKQPLEYN